MNGPSSSTNLPLTHFSECSNLCYDYNNNCHCNESAKKIEKKDSQHGKNRKGEGETKDE